eukprot:TRINITY_DN61689_c0_g1_i1.p2 TRINITY_DN61689_c0_g1~~TRINITY_DN61689_c0_g1_i1.p2  ORF type:complete len:88 (-),score=25.69 TRINITY_DN61689_c0_g1_i1:36-299(-)
MCSKTSPCFDVLVKFECLCAVIKLSIDQNIIPPEESMKNKWWLKREWIQLKEELVDMARKKMNNKKRCDNDEDGEEEPATKKLKVDL